MSIERILATLLLGGGVVALLHWLKVPRSRRHEDTHVRRSGGTEW